MSAEVEHGLLFEDLTVDKTVTRDGTRTVRLRAHHRVSAHNTSATSLHLSVSAAVGLRARLEEILRDYEAEGDGG